MLNKSDQFEKSKLYEILCRLSLRQRKDLLVFVEIPSMKLKEYEIAICKFLIRNVNQKNAISVDIIINEFKSYESVIPKNWNYIKSNILSVVKHYLLMKLSNPNKMPFGFPLLKYFYSKELTKNKESLYNQLDKNLNRDSSSDKNKCYYDFLLQEIKLEEVRLNRRVNDTFDRYNSALDQFYLENKLRIMCENVNRSGIINTRNNNLNLSLWQQNFDVDIYPSTTIRMFYNIYKLLSNSNFEDYFFKIRSDLITLDKNKMTKGDIKSCFEYLLNYCITRYNKLELKWANHYLSVINILEEKQILLDGNTISFSKFKNSITAGLVLGKVDWVEKFVYKYSDHIIVKEKTHILQYNNANIAFHKNDYEKALNDLVGFHSTDIYYLLGYRKLLLKIYYELSFLKPKYKDAINSSINSYTKFIRYRTDLSPRKQNLLLNFTKYLKKLMNSNQFDIDEIASEVPLSDFFWFKKKLGDNQ